MVKAREACWSQDNIVIMSLNSSLKASMNTPWPKWAVLESWKNPPRAPGSTPLYTCLPLVWGAAGGDILDPLYLWDKKLIQEKES